MAIFVITGGAGRLPDRAWAVEIEWRVRESNPPDAAYETAGHTSALTRPVTQ